MSHCKWAMQFDNDVRSARDHGGIFGRSPGSQSVENQLNQKIKTNAPYPNPILCRLKVELPEFEKFIAYSSISSLANEIAKRC